MALMNEIGYQTGRPDEGVSPLDVFKSKWLQSGRSQFSEGDDLDDYYKITGRGHIAIVTDTTESAVEGM
jgi:hypothetical protein